MKTAMQEAIEKLGYVMSRLEASEVNIMGRAARVYQIGLCVIMLTEFIEKEKQQIKDAWDNGENSIEPIDAEKYYNQTYNSKP